MKVLQLFNQYRSLFNGEESVVLRTRELLERHGHECPLWMPSSRDIQGLVAKARAFVGGIYNRGSGREMTRRLREDRPDIVHAHNIYPLLSPAVLAACRRERVPVVMTIHNQGLTCPIASHLCRDEKCERCYGGHEFQCVVRNCRDNLLESLAYAVRASTARRLGLITRNVTYFIALTDFARRRLAGGGYDPGQILVLPNMIERLHDPVDPAEGGYVAFAGRLSPEKDPATLLRAAAQLPGIRVRIAGTGPLEESLRAQAPPNVEWAGRLQREEMAGFYRGARVVVLCSNAFEMCPLVVSEAMSHGLPVVASSVGGVDELVDHGKTGLLFQPGNADELAAQLRRLWDSPQLCRQYGVAGRAKAAAEFAEEPYLERLLAIYQQAIAQVRGAAPADTTRPLETSVR